MSLTPEQEAAYALVYGVRRADLEPEVQAAYDRLVERKAEAARPWAGTLVPLGQTKAGAGQSRAPATWQGHPPQPSWHKEWSVWLFFLGLSCVVVGFIVGGFGGSDASDATNLTSAALFLFGLAAVCVAIPGMLYRRYRARRMAVPPRWPFSPCYGCSYPLAVHFGGELQCPLEGICYRCGRSLTVHSGYELTCPDSKAPHCFRCGQPRATHVGDGLTCPPPWVLAC